MFNSFSDNRQVFSISFPKSMRCPSQYTYYLPTYLPIPLYSKYSVYMIPLGFFRTVRNIKSQRRNLSCYQLAQLPISKLAIHIHTTKLYIGSSIFYIMSCKQKSFMLYPYTCLQIIAYARPLCHTIHDTLHKQPAAINAALLLLLVLPSYTSPCLHPTTNIVVGKEDGRQTVIVQWYWTGRQVQVQMAS